MAPAHRPSERAMRIVAAIAALAFGTAAFGHANDRIIAQASDLVPWCRSEAESRYIARNVTTYQWTASYHEDGSTLYVDGKLRVHGDDVAVRCRIAKGAHEEYG